MRRIAIAGLCVVLTPLSAPGQAWQDPKRTPPPPPPRGITATLGPKGARKTPARAPIPAKVRTLIVQWEYGDAVARLSAAKGLTEMGPQAGAAAALIAPAIADKDADLRQAVCDALCRMGPAAAVAAPALAKALADGNDGVRPLAVRALRMVLGTDGTSDQAVIKALGGALKGKIAGVRIEAAETLVGLAGNAGSVVSDLVGALKDDEARVRLAAARTLVHRGGPLERVLPVLAVLLKDKDVAIRRGAARALRQVGPSARTVVLDLVKALGDADAGVRTEAAGALGRIGPPAAEAVDALVGALTDEQISVRVAAATALGRVGPAAAKAVPDLVRALKKGQDRVRDAAAVALKALGPKAEPAAAALVEALKDNHPLVRHAAADALVAIGKPAVPHLNKRVKDDDGKINMPVIRVLERITSPAPASAPASRPATGADRLTIVGEYRVRCASTWHNINLPFKVSGQFILSGAEARGLIPIDRGNRQCVIPDELTQALGVRLLRSMNLTPSDAQAAAQWLGAGRNNETLKASGRLKAVLLRAKRVGPNRPAVVWLTGRIRLEEGCRLASRYGPNTHKAVWTLDLTGVLTLDATTGQLSAGILNVKGTVEGGYGHQNGDITEPYTATVRLVLRTSAPPKK